MSLSLGMRLASDIGGTFTDTVLMGEGGQILATTKTPTTPQNPTLGAIEGARIVLQRAGVDWSEVTGKIHGTTLATNALIERRGARVATITTAGFRDILEIAYERRYAQYAIDIDKPDLLVPRDRAFTIGGRMSAAGEELAALDEAGVGDLVSALQACQAEAVAICLLHSYANPDHELRLGALLQAALPDIAISLSHQISPEAREFDRLCTTIANAYIQLLMARYLAAFEAGFRAEGLTCPILMMTAGGGMTTLETAARLPIRLVESGPAGGAILAARIAQETDATDVLSFDMGGTTAKLCLIDNFAPQTARNFEIARAERFIKGSGMPVRIPVIEMIEIGAGGGSLAHVDRLGRVQVGPKSAGSDPGPAAFAKGGDHATVTDADVVQGYIQPALFAEGRLTLDPAAAARALARDVGQALDLFDDKAAFAVSEIVDEAMASAGRMHAIESGKDLGARVMIAFGGNGPLHATRVARRAQVSQILIPPDPGVGSAVGFLYAPVSFEVIRSRYARLTALDVAALNTFLDIMQAEAETVVRLGAPEGALEARRVAFARYHGQGHEIEIALPNRALMDADLPDIQTAFEQEYARQFSRVVPGMEIEILNWGVHVKAAAPPLSPPMPRQEPRRISPDQTTQILCDLRGVEITAGVIHRDALAPGDMLEGPALIVEPQTTTLVSPDFNARCDGAGNLWLSRRKETDA